MFRVQATATGWQIYSEAPDGSLDVIAEVGETPGLNFSYGQLEALAHAFAAAPLLIGACRQAHAAISGCDAQLSEEARAALQPALRTIEKALAVAERHRVGPAGPAGPA